MKNVESGNGAVFFRVDGEGGTGNGERKPPFSFFLSPTFTCNI